MFPFFKQLASYTTIPSAIISSVSGPNDWISSAGGDTVTITGTDFISGGLLAFSANGIPCTNVTFVNSTTCMATAPAQTGVASPSSTFTFTGTNGNGSPMTAGNIIYNWDPSQLASLISWYQITQPNDAWATVSDGYITQLLPRAYAAGYNLPMIGSTAAYNVSGINNLPSLDTSVNPGELQNAVFGTPVNQPFSISMVAQQTSLTGAYFTLTPAPTGLTLATFGPPTEYILLGGVSYTLISPTSVTSAPFSIDISYNGTTNSSAYINAVAQGATPNLNGGTPILSAIGINQTDGAGNADNTFSGFISSCLVTNDVLTTDELAALSSWRITYYGIPA